MAAVKLGDIVHIHYEGRLDDGTVFDTSHGLQPLKITVGDETLIATFAQTIVGMTPGESRTITIPAEEAYGPYREEMIVVVDYSQFPADIKPQIGMELNVHQGDDMVVPVTVTGISDAGVTLDANHPLAGKDLTFDIELVEIV